MIELAHVERIEPLQKEQSLRHEVDEIVHRNQELAVAGQFAATVMHEINNPLEAVSNLNFLIQIEADDAKRVRELSDMLEEQLVALRKLSRQTLSFYRSSETVEATGISALAEAALRVHEKRIAAKQITVLKRLRVDATAEVNAGDLLQVLSNLVANAVDALPVKGVLGMTASRNATEVHFTVADDGPGIPVAMMSKIFDPFFTTKKERGTGLGLAICKSIVEKHRGRIQSRSNTRPLRSGTAFRISIPVAARPSALV